MNEKSCAFLANVLGKEGFKALYKAAARAPELENAIVPRAILAWLQCAGIADYEGELPGVEDTYINFEKSEDQYSGAISIGDSVFTFDAASIFHVASCVAVALGADADKLSPAIRDLDLSRLGKTIDVLAKATFVTENLRKAPDRFELLDIDGGPAPEKAFEKEKPATQVQPQDTHKPVQPTPSGSHKCQCGQWDNMPAGFSGEVIEGVRHSPMGCSPVTGRKDIPCQKCGRTGGGVVTTSRGGGVASSSRWVCPHCESNESNRTLAENQVCEDCGGDGELDRRPCSTCGGTGIHSSQLCDYEVGGGLCIGRKNHPGAHSIPDPDVQKVELPGKTHMPTQQVQQTAPQAPQKQPKIKRPSLKVPSAGLTKACPECDLRFFNGENFVGCICFKSLSKHVTTTEEKDGVLLQFDAAWDEDSILALIRSLKRDIDG